MLVKFKNAEIPVWKLRKGIVLGLGSTFVHLGGFEVYAEAVGVKVDFYDSESGFYKASQLDWVEPH